MKRSEPLPEGTGGPFAHAPDSRTRTAPLRVRRWVLLCCVAALALAAVACSGAGTSSGASSDAARDVDATAGDPAVTDADDGTPNWLFSQTSDAGRIEFTGGVATKLVMAEVDLHTIMFSDRPDRQTRVTDTKWFSDHFNDLFADSAPNAVLVEHRPTGGTDSLVVVVSNPHFDVATHTVTYDIEVLADEDHPDSIGGLANKLHDRAPTEFGAVSLFIDNVVCYGAGGTPQCPPPSELIPPPPPPPDFYPGA
jgi:hypothetical protein